MAQTGDFPIHCAKCGEVHRQGQIDCEYDWSKSSIQIPPPRRCSQGHVMGDFPIWLAVGKREFCMTCIEERLPALLDWLGIGRILPLEEAQDDHPM